MQKVKIRNAKKIGILFFVLSLIISFFFKNYEVVRNTSIVIGIFFLSLVILDSIILDLFYVLWIKLGYLLEKIFRPIILTAIYVFIIFPTFLYVKIFKRDMMQIKFKKKDTYWKDSEYKNDMKEPF
tara:strand:- start:262 stop:639 length:378 start_codon:yes stop_codon:yes gene_type:complete